MLPRRPVPPNNQEVSPIMGNQFFVRYPKSDEKQSIVSYARSGKGAQGESVTGGKNSMTIIRKGRY